MDEIFDVAVVGYGPTGLVAASMLGQAGHRVVVCERWPSLYGLPRLTHIDDETARMVQAAGDVDEALRDSTPTEYLWVNGREEELLRMPAAPVGPMGFPTHISMYQPDVEDSIDRRIRTLPNVEIRQGWSVAALAQDATGVELTLTPWKPTEGADAEQRRLRARYVIAADGSKSAIREMLGIERDDFGFNERWLNFDTEWLRPVPAEFRTTKQYCDPARGHMYMIIGEYRQRFEFALLAGESREEFERPKTAWRLLAQTHGLGPEDVRIIRQIVYTFESRVARRWRERRVFLAGDAAHTMPPYLGQGACSGIRDSFNLGWKLDLVLRGLADESLLDTYELERRPHATAITHMAMGLGAIANTHDPDAAAQRDAAFRAGQAPPPPTIPALADGVLHHQPDGTVTPPTGGLVPQGRVTAGELTGRFDDVVGRGFVLVSAIDVAAVLSPEHRGFLSELGCRMVRLGHDVIDEDGVYGRHLHELGAVAYLARPDFVLFGAAADATELTALVDELRVGIAWPAARSAVSA
ncbi:bifunctional 3-(3-hydroxy-phenyl)propionate/3-hydroxycinnamic acid hydroxylase MhpA [Nonomuraea sp. 10N515B]|uniref:bifunctional 3-(3-hydroxy-phenyl)propionate/3-hydroxycinnamic acid hydroxylase MhpA n=1 Tax=Nonomuraea sp. 10N515B TaxID=3457422 RepID=UPI003FCCE8BD